MKNYFSKRTVKRAISMLLAIVMVFTAMPIIEFAVSANPQSTSTADPKTLDDWATWFDAGSSRYAGAVYVDKSVYTATEALSDSYFANIKDDLSFGKDNFGNDNFLVTMSALGSNSEVKGYSYTPTDTMIVLDASTSMGTGSASSTAIDDMVAGANDAIKRLLSLNNYNRVGVVIYNGTSSLLLPLDNYYVKDGNNYLTDGAGVNFLTFERAVTGYDRRGNPNAWENRIVIADNVVNGQKQAVNAQNNYNEYIPQAQGTYTQGGIYTAAQEFLNADPVIEDGKIQGGTNRIPIMVLMTDGEPSYRTSAGRNATIENYAAATNENCDRSNFREDDITCFSTMLTAAWAEGAVTSHYGSDTRFYTLGYNLSSNHQYAPNVLDPMNPNNNLGSRFIGFANKYLAMQQGDVAEFDDTTAWNYDEFTVKRASSTSDVTSLDYVDKYWAASGASNLTAAFDSIVDEIIIQSRYYSTLVLTDQHHQDGFISLTDEIGTYMEVKDIKGVYLGHDKLVTGGMFAEFVMTGKTKNTNYTDAESRAFSRQILEAIAERFGISADAAANLLEVAKENKFIDWNETTGEFSNYMAWYANEDNEYLAPYTGVNALADNSAKYLVRSYFYMGDVLQSHVETSMLYMLVRVREDLETGRQIVDINVPAALLPMVTYTISVDGDTFTEENIVGITCEQKTPISLLYEVGLNDDIYPFNIAEKMSGQDFRKETDPNGDFTGNYIFYTNRWRTDSGVAFDFPAVVDPHVFNHGIMNTSVAQFIPSIENTRYYYTQNTQIYVKNGSDYEIYTGAKPDSSGEFYYKYEWIEGNANNAQLKFTYNPISKNVLSDPSDIISIDGMNGWFVKKGTARFYLGVDAENFDGINHNHKSANTTGTLKWANDMQIVHHNDETHNGYHVLSYLGNNGLVKAGVAQGIKLTKTVETVVAGASDTFTFNIALEGQGIASSYPVRIIGADGTIGDAVERPVISDNISVTLKDGESAYILGIDEGIKYTVTESYSPYYAANSTNSSGIIEVNKLSNVDFVNTPKGYGSLLVSKDVEHPFGEENVPAALASKEFNVTVTFVGDANDLKNIVDYEGTKNTSGKAVFEFTLKDGTSVLFTNIPEGVKYTVTETNLPAGFTLNATVSTALNGTITKDTQSHAILINDYVPTSVTPDITIKGDKTLQNYTGTWSYEFKVALQQVNFGGQGISAVGSPITEINGNPIVMTQTNGYSFNLGDAVKFDKTGTYSYLIYEVDTGITDITYSTKFGLITVTVTDNDVDGALEVSGVVGHVDTVDSVTGDAANGWEIEKNFTNYYNADQVSFDVQKTVNNSIDNEHDSGILFGLFESENATTPTYYAITDVNGVAKFYINVLESAFTPAKTYYLREVKPLVDSSVTGMTYDTDIKYTVTIGWDTVANKATVSYKDYSTGADVAASELRINNTLENVETKPLKLSGTKTLNGGTLRNGDVFEFAVYDTDSTFVPNTNEREKVTATVVDGSLVFDDITFSEAGTHYIKIVEIVGDTTKGVTYDPTEYHITANVVKVYDGTKSTLSVSASDGGSITVYKTGSGNVALVETATQISTNDIDFDNKYHINDYETVSIGGTKTVKAVAPLTRKPLAGEFKFGLFEDGKTEPLYVVTNDVNGKFKFPDLTYTILNETEFNKEYKYTVKEIAQTSGDTKGITTFDSTVYEVTVKLYDDGNGKITKQVLLGTTEVTDVNVNFENEYTVTDAELVLSGTKTLTGREINNGEFTFNLYKTGSNFAITGNPVTTVNSKTTASTGDYSFTLTFDETQIGHHYYVLTEAVPSDTAGVQYDITRYDIDVHVYDNGHGELVAHTDKIVTQYESGTIPKDELDFTNNYQAAPVPYAISGLKNYNKTLNADMFEFILKDENGDEIETVKNKADGSFKFTEIEYTAADTYKYTVEEIKGGTTDKGIKYDSAKFAVEIVVKDNLNGELVIDSVKYTRTDGSNVTNPTDIVFTNEYGITTGTSVEFGGTKVHTYNGTPQTLTEGQFEIGLYDGDVLVKEADVKADGTFSFKLDFNAPANKTYTVKEIVPDSREEGMIYDSAVYTVKVTATDNNEGQLIGAYEIVGATAIAFTNTTNDIIVKDVVNVSAPDISIDGEKVNVGDEITYVITYVNTTGKNVDATITDKLPEFTEFVSATDGGTNNGGNVIWNLDVQKDATKTVKVTVKVTAPQKILLNTAKVFDGTNTYTSNETYNHTVEDIVVKDVTVIAKPEISIDGEKVEVGDVLSYSITYINISGKNVTAEIIDTLPKYTEFVAASDGGVYENGKVTWRIDVKDKEFKTVTLEVRVTAPDEILSNEVKVFDGTNTFTSNEVHNHTVEEELVKDVANVKEPDISIDGEKVNVGDELKYTLSYHNATDKAVKVTITDKVPEHTVFVSAENGGIYDNGTVTWTQDLEPWSSVDVSFVVKVDAKQVFIDNTATALVGQNEVTSNTVTNHTYEEINSKDVVLESKPQISVDGKQVNVGDILEYRISYTNVTDGNVNITITDTIPSNTEFVSAENATIKDNVVTWNINDIEPKREVVVVLKVKVVAAGGLIKNQAQIYDGTNLLTNTVTNAVPEKTVDKSQVSIGEELNFTIKYVNATGAVADVVITDKLSDSLTLVEGTAGNGVYKDGVIKWTVKDVPAGETVIVGFKAKVNNNTKEGTVVNEAVITQNETDVITTNKTETKVLTPEISFVKTQSIGNGEATSENIAVREGDTITYNITVTNNGDGDALGITVSDKLPDGLIYVADSANNGGIYENGTIIWKLDTLKSKESVTFTFKVTVPSVASDTDWANIATLCYDNNPDDKIIETNKVTITEEYDEPAPYVPESPKTGDSSNALLCFVIMLLAGSGLVTVTIAKKKSRK